MENIKMKEDTKFKALKEILYGAGISFILGMIGYALMFFFKLIAARHFGPSDFGMYEMVVTIFGVAVVFGNMGFSSGIQRYGSLYLEKNLSLLYEYKKFVKTIVFIASVFISIMLFIFSDSLASIFNMEIGFFIRIVSIGVIFRNFNQVLSSFFISEKKAFHGKFGVDVVERLILVLGALIIAYFNLDLFYLVIVFVLSLFFALLYTSIAYYFRPFKKVKKVKANKIEWIKYSLPLLFTGILGYILTWTDNFVIGFYLDSTQLGLYGISYSLAKYIVFIPKTLSTLFLPIMTSLFFSSKKDFKQVFNQIIKWSFSVSIFLGGIFIFFSKQILTILFGKEFGFASFPLIILTSFFIIKTIFSFYNFLLLIKKDTMFFLYNNVFFSIFNLILSLILVNRFGINGVAFATGLSLLLSSISHYFKSRKYIKIKFDLFIFIKIILITLFSLILIQLLFTFILNYVNIHVLIKMIIAVVVYTLSFGLSFFIFKIFNKDDIKLMLLLEDKIGIDLGVVKKILKRFV